jgi:hypothetical protein
MVTHSKNMTTKHADFVKMTDIRNIVEEMTLPLLSQMQIREEEAINMKNRVLIISDEIKTARAETR